MFLPVGRVIVLQVPARDEVPISLSMAAAFQIGQSKREHASAGDLGSLSMFWMAEAISAS
jgi:hypothetical protein